jgi:hypothetical protein
MNFHFEDVPQYSQQHALSAIEQNRVEELQVIVIGIALHCDDLAFAEDLCLSLATHADENVRGNAILGFGHLARRFRRLGSREIKTLLEAALQDDSPYVRGQAWAAADDLSHFLGWTIKGFEG